MEIRWQKKFLRMVGEFGFPRGGCGGREMLQRAQHPSPSSIPQLGWRLAARRRDSEQGPHARPSHVPSQTFPKTKML